MKRILVAYCTNAGSTAEVAEAVGASLSGPDAEVEVRRLEQVEDPGAYSAAVIGAPMILGWHRRAVRFLNRHRTALARIPVALFFTAMQVTRLGNEQSFGLPVAVDPRVTKDTARPRRLSFKERHTTVGSYLRPIRRAIAAIRPVSGAFFAGKLDYGKLKLPQMLFVMLIIAARPGDARDWERIRSWAREVRPALMTAKEEK